MPKRKATTKRYASDDDDDDDEGGEDTNENEENETHARGRGRTKRRVVVDDDDDDEDDDDDGDSETEEKSQKGKRVPLAKRPKPSSKSPAAAAAAGGKRSKSAPTTSVPLTTLQEKFEELYNLRVTEAEELVEEMKHRMEEQDAVTAKMRAEFEKKVARLSANERNLGALQEENGRLQKDLTILRENERKVKERLLEVERERNALVKAIESSTASTTSARDGHNSNNSASEIRTLTATLDFFKSITGAVVIPPTSFSTKQQQQATSSAPPTKWETIFSNPVKKTAVKIQFVINSNGTTMDIVPVAGSESLTRPELKKKASVPVKEVPQRVAAIVSDLYE